MHPETLGSGAETAEPLCAMVTVMGPKHPSPSSQSTMAVPDHVPARLMAGNSGVGVVRVELPEPQATTVSPASATEHARRGAAEIEERIA